jgi:hypothetical protein
MPYLDNRVYDNGLTVLDTEANAIHICSAEPTTYAEATSTLTLGNATGVTVGAPADRTGGGREVVVDAAADGNVTADGTASHYAVVDTVNARLLAASALTASQVVTNGNTFTLASFTIGIPDPV